MQVPSAGERAMREAAMRWLDGRPHERVDYQWLTEFVFDGERVPLIDRQRGIRKPRGFHAALAIRTTFTAPSSPPPYADAIGSDGLQRYKYRGDDPQHPENVALRNAYLDQMPMIWFVAVASGVYEPIYPVYVIGDEPADLQFVLAVDEGQRLLSPSAITDETTRRYVERMTKARLHQPVFRSKVMVAYQTRCAVCQIRHASLLDAAHIVPDGRPHGDPVVANGLSLCKIHHAAFDDHILGVRPDRTIHVRQDVLDETDGWMLTGGIQAVHDTALAVVPRRAADQPSADRLEERYAEFLLAH